MITCYDEKIYLGFYLHLNKDIHIYRENITYDKPLDSFRFIFMMFCINFIQWRDRYPSGFIKNILILFWRLT